MRAFGLAVAILLAVGLLASGCSILQPAGNVDNYFPHTPGNSWLMTDTLGGSRITTVESRTVPVGSVDVQCFWGGYRSPTTGGLITYETYYRVDNSGVYSYSTLVPPTWGDQLFAFPLEVGKTWEVLSLIGSVESRETLTVPAGSFDCFKVSLSQVFATGETVLETYWLSNNVGVVKETYSTVEATLVWKNF